LKAAYGLLAVRVNGAFDNDCRNNCTDSIGTLALRWCQRTNSNPEIDDSLTLVDYSKVELDDEKQTIFLTRKKSMRLALALQCKKEYINRLKQWESVKSNGVVTAIVDLARQYICLKE